MTYAAVHYKSGVNLRRGAVVVALNLDTVRRLTIYFRPDGTAVVYPAGLGVPHKFPSWEEGLEYLERL